MPGCDAADRVAYGGGTHPGAVNRTRFDLNASLSMPARGAVARLRAAVESNL